MSLAAIVFYLLVIDSIGYNIIVWFGDQWYTRHFRIFSRWFPAVQGWGIYYLILVAWIGYITYSAGMLR